MNKSLRVAVGVLRRDDTYLLGQRPSSKDHAGKWEFPGGKFESGETLSAALSRELQEELGIRSGRITPLFLHSHDYGGYRVDLDVALVEDWQGEPRAIEHQSLGWFYLEEIEGMELPEANYALVRQLKAIKQD